MLARLHQPAAAVAELTVGKYWLRERKTLTAYCYVAGRGYSVTASLQSAQFVNPTFAARIQQAVREAATIWPRPCKLTFDLLTLKVVSESYVKWATFVPILVFLSLSVLDLSPMYATDRQTSDRQTSDAHHLLMPPTIGARHNKYDRPMIWHPPFNYRTNTKFQSLSSIVLTYRAARRDYQLPVPL